MSGVCTLEACVEAAAAEAEKRRRSDGRMTLDVDDDQLGLVC